MSETNQGMHRAYLVFIGVCMMFAGGMGLVLNVVGNYFVPIAQQLFGAAPDQFGPHMTEVVLIMTVYSYVMAVMLPISGQLYQKIDGRILFGVAGILVCGATALMGVWDNLIFFYISGAVWGLAGPMLWIVGPSVLINNWFAPHRAGKMLGIASAFTGVGAFVWSPVFGNVITTMGYKTGFFLEAAIVFVLIVLPAIFLFRTHPSDMGLQPCGVDDPEEKKAATEVKATGGLNHKYVFATLAFYLIFLAACIISLGGGYKSTMPAMVVQHFGGESGSDPFAYYTMIGAWMISTAAVGNMTGKIFLGFLSDKIGVKTSVIIFAVLAVLGFGLLFLGSQNGIEAILLVGAFGLGTADALMSVGLPLTTRTVFGLKHYGKIYSYLSIGIAILGGLGAPMVTTIAGATGNYSMGYVVGVIGFAVVGLFLVVALINAKSFRNKWEEE